jgi:hypothetical protein
MFIPLVLCVQSTTWAQVITTCNSLAYWKYKENGNYWKTVYTEEAASMSKEWKQKIDSKSPDIVFVKKDTFHIKFITKNNTISGPSDILEISFNYETSDGILHELSPNPKYINTVTLSSATAPFSISGNDLMDASSALSYKWKIEELEIHGNEYGRWQVTVTNNIYGTYIFSKRYFCQRDT